LRIIALAGLVVLGVSTGNAAVVLPVGDSESATTFEAGTAWLGSFNASYQAAQPGDTITVPAGTYGSQVVGARAELRGGTCSITNTANCVTFVAGGNVQINGNLEVHGAGIRVDGGNKLRVSGYTHTEGDSTTQYPDHVVFEDFQSGNIGVYSSTDVTFRNVDVGPATVGAGCNRVENKIGYGSGIEVVPSNILFDGLRIHDQNVNSAGRASDCHYGGLFIVTVDGLTIRNSVFERNVVYHVQIQNFSGPPARRVVFDGNSFGCPVEWLDVGDVCDGQHAIQFDYDPAGQFTLTNNVAANGPNGLYGCYVGTCGGLTSVIASGNVNLAASTTAPPLPGTPPSAACSDTIDNDGDGLTDYPADPGCVSAQDTDEFNAPPPGTTLTLTKIAETNSTITFAWQPVVGALGYRFSSSAAPKYTHTWDGSRSTVKFAKGADWYKVEALMPGPFGDWPN
jgi:hypothetical protein